MSLAARLRDWCLRHLARPRPAQRFVPQIDGLRFVAILAVILYHLQGFVAANTQLARGDGGWLHQLLKEGHFGVPLFFALSGYILCTPFLGDRPPRLRDYFLRRLTRLEPPYLISLLLIFGLKLWVLGHSYPELFPRLLASVFYLHGPIYGEHSAVNGVAWSLEVEWQFYLVAPLCFGGLLWLQRRIRMPLLLVLLVLGGLVHANASVLDPRLGLSLVHYFGFFAAGIAVAFAEREWTPGAVDGRMDLLGLLVIVAIALALLASSRAPLALLPALTGLLLVASLRGPRLREVLGWWPIHCIGAMCYTIYLYHFFVISALGRLLPGLWTAAIAPDLLLLICVVLFVPLVLAACALPYLLIERPFMAWRPGRRRAVDPLATTPAPSSADLR